MSISDLSQKDEPSKKEEMNSETDKIISKNDSLKNWDTFKTQIIKQAGIEIKKKLKNILYSTDLDQIINILIDHIENIPNFFDECITEERKNEIRKEIREKAIKIVKEVHKEEKQNMNNLEELEKKMNEPIEMMEKEKRREEMEQLMKKKYEECKKLELEEGKIYSENESKKKDEECSPLEEEKQKEIEIKKEEERKWRERGFNCLGCQKYFQQQREDRFFEDLISRNLQGEFGSCLTESDSLGSLYPEVQKRINERLGITKRH